jgi:hypothetical protein
MDRRKLVATIVERFGVKLDHDDPAFILVELNHLVLEESAGKVADDITKAAEKLNTATTRSVDDFVAVANEALSKFIHQTNQLKTALDAMGPTSAEQPGKVVQAAPVAAEKKEPPSGRLWWFIPGAFAVGVLAGALLAFLALKL